MHAAKRSKLQLTLIASLVRWFARYTGTHRNGAPSTIFLRLARVFAHLSETHACYVHLGCQPFRFLASAAQVLPG